jgi:hypothetical protein
MPDLVSRSLFSGEGEPSPLDLGNTEVTNFHTDVDNQLRENFKWKGKLVGAIGLTLTPDNTKVLNGIFLIGGATCMKEVRIPCNHIWAGSSSDVFLALSFPSADVFRFSDGGLISNFVSSTHVVHSYHSPDGSVVLGDRRAELNITDFSARMICELSGSSDGRRGIFLKYQILFFPATYLEMFENPDARHGGFPGIKVAEGNFPLLPRPSTPWGCPVLPFTLPGVAYEDMATTPAGYRVRNAIAAIMRRTVQPVSLGGHEIISRWEYLRTHPRLLEGVPPNVTWPPPTAEEPDAGKTIVLHCPSFTLPGWLIYLCKC